MPPQVCAGSSARAGAGASPEDEAALFARTPTGLFIDGLDRAAARTFGVEDPSTGRVVAEVADGTEADGLLALSAAAAAQADWSARGPRERGEVLRRAYELIADRADALAALITLEAGKPTAEARAEVAYGSAYFRWYSEEAVRAYGRYARTESGGGRILTLPQPVGPCLLVTPWNFPLAMAARKIAPALATGCTCVVKPAAQTPLTTLALAAVLAEAGLPPGVLNVVPTTQAGPIVSALMTDARLRKLSFTGSTPVGQALVRQAAHRMLRTSMELGGNAPFLVFADADVARAVDGAVAAKVRNAGQACTAANRFLVHRSVEQEFSERLTERLSALAVGRGASPGVDVGPLIDARQRDRVSRLVEDAVAQGATVTTGGRALDGEGHFYPPTVLAGVLPGSRILQEEIFGPVAPITAFDNDAMALALANGSDHGLAAYVWTGDMSKALSVSERLDCGMVGLNTGAVSDASAPFGGLKLSGHGREGGPEGMHEYTELKYVAVPA